MHSKMTPTRARLASQLRGRILDCGCGEGIYGPILRRPENEVISLDLDEEALSRLPGIRVVASCADIPFADDSFDAVWSCAIIEHVKEETLSEMIRVAKVGGRVIAITPNARSPFDPIKKLCGLSTWGEVPGHIRLYDVKDLSFYGTVRGETWFVPRMGWFFWRVPSLAHVLIVDLPVTRELKDKVARRYPRAPHASPPTPRFVGPAGQE